MSKIVDKVVEATSPGKYFAEFTCPHCSKILGASWSQTSAAMNGCIINMECPHCSCVSKLRKAVNLYVAAK